MVSVAPDWIKNLDRPAVPVQLRVGLDGERENPDSLKLESDTKSRLKQLSGTAPEKAYEIIQSLLNDFPNDRSLLTSAAKLASSLNFRADARDYAIRVLRLPLQRQSFSLFALVCHEQGLTNELSWILQEYYQRFPDAESEIKGFLKKRGYLSCPGENDALLKNYTENPTDESLQAILDSETLSFDQLKRAYVVVHEHNEQRNLAHSRRIAQKGFNESPNDKSYFHVALARLTSDEHEALELIKQGELREESNELYTVGLSIAKKLNLYHEIIYFAEKLLGLKPNDVLSRRILGTEALIRRDYERACDIFSPLLENKEQLNRHDFVLIVACNLALRNFEECDRALTRLRGAPGYQSIFPLARMMVTLSEDSQNEDSVRNARNVYAAFTRSTKDRQSLLEGLLLASASGLIEKSEIEYQAATIINARRNRNKIPKEDINVRTSAFFLGAHRAIRPVNQQSARVL